MILKHFIIIPIFISFRVQAIANHASVALTTEKNIELNELRSTDATKIIENLNSLTVLIQQQSTLTNFILENISSLHKKQEYMNERILQKFEDIRFALNKLEKSAETKQIYEPKVNNKLTNETVLKVNDTKKESISENRCEKAYIILNDIKDKINIMESNINDKKHNGTNVQQKNLTTEEQQKPIESHDNMNSTESDDILDFDSDLLEIPDRDDLLFETDSRVDAKKGFCDSSDEFQLRSLNWYFAKGRDSLDNYMTNTTGCLYEDFGNYNNASRVYAGLFNGTLEQWIGIRTFSPVNIILYRNKVRTVRISLFLKSKGIKTTTVDTGARGEVSQSNFESTRTISILSYMAILIKVEPERVTVMIDCDTGKQVVYETNTPIGTPLVIIANKQLHSLLATKMLHCPAIIDH